MVFGLDAVAVAAIVSAAAAAGTAATGVAQAQTSANNARKQSRVQDKAQKDAAAGAAAQLRQNEEAQRSATRKQPVAGDLLTAEQTDRMRGPQSTLLTQGGAGKASLGRATLLGS